MILSGKSKCAGILGWPVGHSKSPRLQGYWLQHYGIDGCYLPLPTPPAALHRVVPALADLGFCGFNVTVPHKETILEFCDTVTSRARRIGAVNTVVIDKGKLTGDNSDGFGFAENLKSSAPDWQASAGPAVVLGAGGAARAVIVALQDLGVPEIRLLNRSADRAEGLSNELALPEGAPIIALPWDTRSTALAGAGLLVNATSLGMAGQPPLEIDLTPLPAQAVVVDIVYAPLETDLLAAAKHRQNPWVDGIGMLLHQGRVGFEAWFGQAPEVTQELRDFVLEG